MSWLPTLLVAAVCYLTTTVLGGTLMDAVLMYLLLVIANR
jgi:hypothetical protein